jgi:hypothetical protein
MFAPVPTFDYSVKRYSLIRISLAAVASGLQVTLKTE